MVFLLKSSFCSEPLITWLVPTLFLGTNVVDAATAVPPSAMNSAKYETTLRRRC
jgi:hypothetical protein